MSSPSVQQSGSDKPLQAESSGLSGEEKAAVIIGGGVGVGVGGAVVGTGVSALAKTESGANLLQNMATAIKNSKIGEVTNNIATAIKNSNVAKFLSSGPSKLIGKTLGPLADVANVGFNLYQDIATENVSDVKRGINISGSIIGGALDIGVSMLFPPAALFQIAGAVLDMAWDPFKNYYNHDLVTMKNQFDEEYGKILRKSGLDWPLEIKPDFINLDKTAPDYETNLEELQNYIQKYYDNNGLIQQEDVLAEEMFFIDMQNLKRLDNLYSYDENGDPILTDPLLSSLTLKASADQNILLSLALATYIKKHKLARRGRLDYFFDYLKYNLLPLFFFILLIISTTIVLYFVFRLNIMKTYIIGIVLLLALLLMFTVSFFSQTEKFTDSNSIPNKSPAPSVELLPQCENMTPQTLLVAFNNDIDKLTSAILQAGITIESLKIPGLYPYIASVLVQKNLLVC